MHITFTYNPRREVGPLRVGMGSQSSSKPTTFALEAQAAGIDITSEDQVAEFSLAKIARENLDITELTHLFASAWTPVENEATERFQKIFQTDWDPGEVTAYLTLSSRCPYSFKERHYFVSVIGWEKPVPIKISLHELIHFYTHQLIEPLFVEAGIQNKHHDFKEALSILLNVEFHDLLDELDWGYPQHKELRQEISQKYQSGKNVYEIAKEYIVQQV